MALLARKTYILAKAEATVGTNSSPANTDAVLVKSLELTPLAGDVVSRDLIRGYLGNSESLIAQTYVELKFDVELAGSGTAGTAPRYGNLLQACGLALTTVASTSNTYAPVSSSFGSSTIVYNTDGLNHVLTGCRGSFSIKAEVGQIPTLSFTMMGVYNAPTDVSPVSASYTAQATPLVFRQGNTSAFSIFSYSGLLQSFDFDLANSTVYRQLVGSSAGEVLITDRKPAGSCMIEAPPTLATKDFFAIALASATGGLSFTHGTTAGNRVVFSSPQTDITTPAYGEADGVRMLNLPYVSVPTTAGNDEFSLAFT
jgi:hypothetical protein